MQYSMPNSLLNKHSRRFITYCNLLKATRQRAAAIISGFLIVNLLATGGIIILTTGFSTKVYSQTAHSPKAQTPSKILVLGDSLSAAYGFNPQDGWVSLLATKLENKAEIINASISGETTSGGLTRLPSLLEQHRPNLLLLELGANDGLRGLPPAGIQANLEQIIELAHAADAQVLLLGIYLPPNYGQSYLNQFDAIYPYIADKYSLVYLPFLLAGVAESNHLMQNDGLHPKVEGQPIILNNVWPLVKSFFQ